MRIALYPGSFDPLTRGHLDIIKRTAGLFDHLVVGVIQNPNKKSFLSLEKRKELIEKVLEFEKIQHNISVDSFNGLMVNYAKSKNVDVIIRGLRATSDYEYEQTLAQMNRHLYKKLETIFLVANPKYSFISSNLIKEVFQYGGDICEYVHPIVLEELKALVKK